jgi:hypothetical protein
MPWTRPKYRSDSRKEWIHARNCGHLQFSSRDASVRLAAALESPGGCKVVVPRKQRGRRETGCPVHPRPACSVGSTRWSPQVCRINRPSLRNGFNGFLRALPGDRALLPPSPLRSLLLKSLAPASGRQDHTALPSASCAVVIAWLKRSRDPKASPCDHCRARTLPASTAFRPASVTIAIRPSFWDGTKREHIDVVGVSQGARYIPVGHAACFVVWTAPIPTQGRCGTGVMRGPHG